MSSETSNTFRIMRKTVQFDLKIDCYSKRNFKSMDFPVICDGKEDIHWWEFAFVCYREHWVKKSPTGDRNRFIHTFSLSANQTDNFKYESSFYIIHVAAENGLQLGTKTGDLSGESYNQFTYDKSVFQLAKAYKYMRVTVTLQSRVIESPIRTNLKWLLDRGTLCDVVIKTTGKEFPCHKVILAAASEYLLKMFQVDMKEKDSVIDWVGVFEADVVQVFLHYVYIGYTPPNLANTVLVLIEMANTLRMDDLKTLCTYQLKNVMNANNVGDILQMAVKNEDGELQKIAINFIVQNFKEESPYPWDKVEPECLSSVVTTMMKMLR